MLDISKTGACLKIQKEANLSVGGTILLEILSRDNNNINIKEKSPGLNNQKKVLLLVLNLTRSLMMRPSAVLHSFLSVFYSWSLSFSPDVNP